MTADENTEIVSKIFILRVLRSVEGSAIIYMPINKLYNLLLFFPGLGQREVNSRTAGGGSKCLWRRLLVTFDPRGANKAYKWGPVDVWEAYNCIPDHGTVLEDLYWAGGRCYSSIKTKLYIWLLQRIDISRIAGRHLFSCPVQCY